MADFTPGGGGAENGRGRLWISSRCAGCLRVYPHGVICWGDMELRLDQGKRCASSRRLWISRDGNVVRGDVLRREREDAQVSMPTMKAEG